MILESLSNIELFYTDKLSGDGTAVIDGDEFIHLIKVMRHRSGDVVFFTNGKGKLFNGIIDNIGSQSAKISIIKKRIFRNEKENICFCIPKLKNPSRFEFALEKSAELGITSFIIIETARTISKSNKMERWQSILLSAMKQSLRTYLPKILNVMTLENLVETGTNFIVFDQSGEKIFNQQIHLDDKKKYHFVFGPEGGLSGEELKLFHPENIYSLSTSRLRTETAIIKCAALL